MYDERISKPKPAVIDKDDYKKRARGMLAEIERVESTEVKSKQDEENVKGIMPIMNPDYS